ncbi:hypothetical protein O181_000637 [Austropuccinia psidii MF-1]|uniref:Elongin-A n=1 Tax=Austropuccinia psidii MF-1 TaxID=1389203 RepID=A0A9Q3B999_9BASI|nr:hypothetical protein [Austropuccinia psidii MF-1]
MAVASLKESCLRTLTAHSASLFEVGPCPYRLIRPVLFACQPDQLAYIEDNSPHLMLDSDEIWALLLSRDFPNQSIIPIIQPNQSSVELNSSDLNLNSLQIKLPSNRVKYYEALDEKEQALASASARLRQRTLENRSDQGKRKAIFTREADFGLGSKIKKPKVWKSWGSSTSSGKTLAEKARQQVKKSAAVYANAARTKRLPPHQLRENSNPNSQTPSLALSHESLFTTATQLKSKTPPSSSNSTKPTSTTIKLVKVPYPSSPSAFNNNQIVPTPFPKPLSKTLPMSHQTMRLHTTTSSTQNHLVEPPAPLPPTAALLRSKALERSSSAKNQTPDKKLASLFIPKSKPPWKPTPSKKTFGCA